jgi:alkanesulfonate monooxygenase SsuD/methylene tetrahydromethanopterin reductase-like flavin-dependent oxidoreductase (luciferase family)
VESFEDLLTLPERALLNEAHTCSVSGSPETVRKALEAFIAQTEADEIMVSSHIYDHTARLRSFDIVAEVTIRSSTRLDTLAHRPDSPYEETMDQ